jgi:hypothetical protein
LNSAEGNLCTGIRTDAQAGVLPALWVGGVYVER